MTTWLLGSLRDQLVADVAHGRGLNAERVRELIARAPLTADDAKRAGLVDEIADWPTFVESVRAMGGDPLEEVSLDRYLRASRPDASGPTVAVVVVEGTIVRGDSGYSPLPLFGGDMAGADTLASAFRAVRESDAVAAVVRVDSPGGSPVASEAVRGEVARTAERIPVVVSMGDVAASGGYWITCGATRVVAGPATLTASIGVYGGHLAMARFWEEKLGVTWGRVEGDPNADIFGTLDAWTPAQRAAATRLLDRVYGAFLDRVAGARGLTRDEVDAVGQGRVFTGAQALERGLVDELGGFDQALAAARELAGLRQDAPVTLEFYPRYPTLWERILEQTGREAAIDAVARSILAGRFASPGATWMPPITVE
jgi:protease-4